MEQSGVETDGMHVEPNGLQNAGAAVPLALMWTPDADSDAVGPHAPEEAWRVGADAACVAPRSWATRMEKCPSCVCVSFIPGSLTVTGMLAYAGPTTARPASLGPLLP